MRYEFAPAGVAPAAANEFYIYVSHYKSGTTAADVKARLGEAQIIRTNEAIDLPATARVLCVGDYNVDDSGAFATSLCLLLMLGVLASDHPDSISKDGILAGLPAESQETDVTSLSAPTTAAATTLAIAAAAASESGIAVSTNHVTS